MHTPLYTEGRNRDYLPAHLDRPKSIVALHTFWVLLPEENAGWGWHAPRRRSVEKWLSCPHIFMFQL